MKELLTYLEAQRDQKFTFEGKDHYLLAQECMTYIGHQDSHIRDNIIYPSLAHLLHDKLLTPEQLKSITNDFLSETYLLYDLENKEEYSVLTRSFTTLQLAILVYVHNRDGLYSKEEFNHLFETFMRYFRQETIYIGHVPEVGFLHSIAHGADLFVQFAKAPEISKQNVEDMWHAIKEKFLIDNYIYVSDEQERMALFLEESIKRNLLDESFIIEWAKGLYEYEKTNAYPEHYAMKLNSLNLIRSLYFRILQLDVSEETKTTLLSYCENYR